MIRHLRRQHRTVIVLLTILLAIVFIAGMIVRKPAPVNPQLPNSLLPASTGGQR
ncbi:MAG: hypothetical protein SF097_03865 [Acidobacteriota bacterium]|nr:hypothetical protein [Acidobacteriota bacterium]